MSAEKKRLNWIMVAIIFVIAIAIPWFKVAQGLPVVNQGIDIIGGVDLLLQAKVPEGEEEITPDMMAGAIDIVRNRLDPEGIKEIGIQKMGDDRIIVQIPNEDDPERVRGMIGETAILRFIDAGTDPIPEGTKIRFVDPETGKPVGILGWQDPDEDLGLIGVGQDLPETVVMSEQILFKSSDLTGFRIITEEPPAAPEPPEGISSESVVSPEGAVDGTVEEPAIEEAPPAEPERYVVMELNPEAAIQLPSHSVLHTGEYLVLAVDNTVQSAVKIDSAMSSVVKFPDLLGQPGFNVDLWNKQLSRMKIVSMVDVPELGTPLDIWDPTGQYVEDVGSTMVEGRMSISTDKIILTGDDFADASVSFGQLSNPQIAFKFEREGKNIFGRYTAQNVNKFLAIALDDEVISCPRIREPILNGSGVIDGAFSRQEAQDLVVKLDAGRLPVPLVIIENRTVGPTLGAKSVEDSKRAALLSIVLVLLFMIIYYRMPGVAAAVALIYYGFVFFGTLSIMNATLTLPGIAGFILSLGMAVDANVIIFERLKEELLTGKTFRSAVEAAFKRAFAAIFDSNVTTLITAMVLYNLGTGPIRGFAVTLSLGILVSMFSALIFTRLLLEAVLSSKALQKYSLFGIREGDVAVAIKGGGKR